MFINERDLDFVARDIVNQLSGLWEIDIDIRQSTIEKADDLVHQAIWDRIC